jgi:hypothetical protein
MFADQGAQYIAEALKTILNKINLFGNSLIDQGACWIAEALECNSTLIEMDLRFC